MEQIAPGPSNAGQRQAYMPRSHPPDRLGHELASAGVKQSNDSALPHDLQRRACNTKSAWIRQGQVAITCALHDVGRAVPWVQIQVKALLLLLLFQVTTWRHFTLQLSAFSENLPEHL